MKYVHTATFLGIAAGLGVAALTGPVHAQDYERITPRTAAQRLAVGTPVKVKLLQGLSSETASVGQRVRVQIAGDDSSGLPVRHHLRGPRPRRPPRDPPPGGRD